MNIIDSVKVRQHKGKIELDVNPIALPLPTVSVVTITKNRQVFFDLPIRNWTHFKYPHDSIEWVIVDDSKTDELKNILPKDSRIRYFYLTKPLPVSDKRNFAVKKCKGEIIVHMDDDDFYFNDSILAKVRVLADNPHKDCIFSKPLGIHDIMTNKSAIANSSDTDIPEATMAYRKSFWKKGKFRNHNSNSEWYGFCMNRWDKLINMPFWFNMIATTHTTNVTGKLRQLARVPNKAPNFNSVWDEETGEIIRSIKKKLQK